MQACVISSVLTMEIPQSCINPLLCSLMTNHVNTLWLSGMNSHELCASWCGCFLWGSSHGLVQDLLFIMADLGTSLLTGYLDGADWHIWTHHCRYHTISVMILSSHSIKGLVWLQAFKNISLVSHLLWVWYLFLWMISNPFLIDKIWLWKINEITQYLTALESTLLGAASI